MSDEHEIESTSNCIEMTCSSLLHFLPAHLNSHTA